MDFENQYLEYDEYQELGGILPEMPFNLLEYDAEKTIDKYTSNRFRSSQDIVFPDELKMCVNKLIEISMNDDNIVSEKKGDYSITKISKVELEKEKKNIIISYLSNMKINDVLVIYCGEDL